MPANNDAETSRTASSQKELSSIGIINLPCKYSVDETVERLKGILQDNGATLFLLMDHSGEAKKAGMEMRPTKVLIFGSPKAGTRLMTAFPSIALDLPLKILVWEDAQGVVWVTYNSPDFLQRRHGLPVEMKKVLEVVARFATQATE